MSGDPEQLIRTYWQRVWLDRDLSALDELMTDPVTRHTTDGSASIPLAAFRDRLSDALTAVRSKEMSIDGLTVDGETVWLRLTLHSISMATMSPMPLTYMAQYRVADGRIAEIWQLHQSGLDWTKG